MKILSFILALLISSTSFGQLTLQKTLTPEQLVKEVFVGEGIKSISNVSIKGTFERQFASFTGSMVGGFTEGIFMASGDVDSLILENGNDDPSFFPNAFSSYMDPTETDFDLQNIAGKTIKDVAVLEFDFVPEGNRIEFEFVFGSEEYGEYVCSQYNDAFGFLIRGPGIIPMPQGKNFALIPGTSTPISINSINGGMVGGNGDPIHCVSLIHSNYYVDNLYNVPPANKRDPYFTRFNGLTVPITVQADVICDSTYHIKLMVGDGGSGFNGNKEFDSGIFLKSKSFNTATYSLSPQGENGSNIAWEGDQAYFEVVRYAFTGNTSIDINFSGSAIQDIDYSPSIPQTLNFDGSDTVRVYLENTKDQDELEGDENIIASISFINECGNSIYKSDTLVLRDRYDVIVPNVITPNGDGENELFSIKNLDQYDASIVIKNRWGKTVYENASYQGDWDGQGVSDGVYFYELLLQDIKEIRTGHVQIIR